MFKVADLFCGPGGIAEGFRLAGFKIVYGLDKDKTALFTFQKNHPDAVVVGRDASELDPYSLPDFDILVGGPPCVNFSTSKGGRANILDGLKLVQAFLRVVYERKPKYWVMENVPRLAIHLPESIPLSWIGIDKKGELEVPRRTEFNTADYGVPQLRRRFLVGNYPEPKPTHTDPTAAPLLTHAGDTPPWRTLADVLRSLPSPLDDTNNAQVTDLNYSFSIEAASLTDHFYDPTLNDEELISIRKVKEEHPYMGRMAFPDDTNRPARTVVATQLGRETIVIGYEKNGKEFYRRATVRECATLQTFPITYQFWGNSLGARYRMAGDAVPPMLTMHIAREILRLEGRKIPETAEVKTEKIELSPTLEFTRRRKKQTTFPINRKFRELVPGKEVRGCRVDFDNQGDNPEQAPFCSPAQNHLVEWVARLYVGEGKANTKIKAFTLEEAVSVLANYPRSTESDEYELSIQLLNQLEERLIGEVCDATTLQAVWSMRSRAALGPYSLVALASAIINDIFPKGCFGETFVPRVEGSELLPARGLRIRIAAGLVASALITDLANSDTRWLEENHSERYLPEEWDCEETTNGFLHVQAQNMKTLFKEKVESNILRLTGAHLLR